MLQSLNFKHIFYFWAVAKQGSISKASILLSVSPSSISEQLKTLEKTIGCDLFDRSQKKMILTTNGKDVFLILDEFFPAIEEIFESLVNHKSSDVKFLRIGLCPTLSQELRYKLCFPFIEDYHYIVKILQGENQFLLDAFNKDEVDLLFTTNDQMNPNGRCEKLRLARKEFYIIVNKDVYKKLPKVGKLKALYQFKYINYTPDSDLHFKSLNFMHRNGLRPIRMAEIDDINLTKKTIMNTECFSILPINAVKVELEKGTLMKVGEEVKEVESQILAIYKPSFQSDSFREHLQSISISIQLAKGVAKGV